MNRFGTLAPPSSATNSNKVTRDAFLYLDGKTSDFAQCGSCWLFDKERERCGVLSPSFEVYDEDSCGYWGPGPTFSGEPRQRFTPRQVGFVRRAVRCENCRYFDSGECGLFRELNETLPDKFSLDVDVEARGCCNAQTPR